MTESDREPILAFAALAALADGSCDAAEQAAIDAAAARLGLPGGAGAASGDASPKRLAALAGALSGPEARRAAYQTALAVCLADGHASVAELRFLETAREALGLSPADVAPTDEQADALARSAAGPAPAAPEPAPASEAALDELIRTQAVFTGALELLPDRLANIAILPLQLRLVHRVGQHYGRELDAAQVRDLAGALGVGAAAQVFESVARKVLGGIAGGLLGGLAGGATGLAAGAAVTFSTTYALGHAAKQYYAQGRKLDADDLRALFTRFQGEAKALFPQLEEQIRAQSRSLDVQSLLRMLRGG